MSRYIKTLKLYSRFDYIYPSFHVTEDEQDVTFYPYMNRAVNDASNFIDKIFTENNKRIKS